MALPKSTQVKIPQAEVDGHFAELVQRANSGREHFIVEKDGLPVVAILSVAEYEALISERDEQQSRAAKRQQFHQIARQFGEAIQEAGISEAELDAIVEETRQQMHEERHGSEPAK